MQGIFREKGKKTLAKRCDNKPSWGDHKSRQHAAKWGKSKGVTWGQLQESNN